MLDERLELLSIRETCERVSLSRTSLYHAVRDGRFPRPVVLGPGRKAFVAHEIQRWIADRIADRDGAVE